MFVDDTASALHNKSTRGEILTSEEQAQLGEWYAAQDEAEHISLDAVLSSAIPELQTEVTSIVARCVVLAQRIQDLSHHNEDLRRDIVQLRQQVAHQIQPV